MLRAGIFRHTGILILLFTISLLAQLEDEKQRLYVEYKQITERLQDIQEKALTDAVLAKQSEQFANKVDQEMIRQNPTIRQRIDRKKNIIEEFERARSTGNQSEMQKLQQEFQVIAQELRIYQQDAMENAELKREGEVLGIALRKKMEEIDPKVPELIARLEFLGNQLQELQKTL